ncbi:hypothetical protein C8A05DRAFT_13120 [Staphylotrichum tortipilum]|uniref:Uncharacterized protein n=1 Tax=Staphylotrichum tortipilum TaxID=2831512 RepID=A0AAN6MQ55_9PEZI|nr:hypothetical protein C8A05DRAFT_13120 [Staphylotrichum longicolle]
MSGKEPATRHSLNSSSEEEEDPSREKNAAFIGYRAFPPIMNLHINYSGVLTAFTSQKLCGLTEDDFLYLVEVHFGFTPRGPLNFGRGFYLRNGTSNKDPILAAAGEKFRLPLLVLLFDPSTAVKMPPLDVEKNPRDMVTENLQSTKSKEHGVAFRFAIEVGTKRLRREGFEWRKPMGSKQDGEGDSKGSRYTLIRLAPGLPPPAVASSSAAAAVASSSSAPPEPAEEVVAELTFRNVLSLKHIFTLELKGAGLTGELGERWTLMVVMTALGLNFLRQMGKTNKTTVGAAQKLHSKSK